MHNTLLCCNVLHCTALIWAARWRKCVPSFVRTFVLNVFRSMSYSSSTIWLYKVGDLFLWNIFLRASNRFAVWICFSIYVYSFMNETVRLFSIFTVRKVIIFRGFRGETNYQISGQEFNAGRWRVDIASICRQSVKCSQTRENYTYIFKPIKQTNWSY